MSESLWHLKLISIPECVFFPNYLWLSQISPSDIFEHLLIWLHRLQSLQVAISCMAPQILRFEMFALSLAAVTLYRSVSFGLGNNLESV